MKEFTKEQNRAIRENSDLVVVSASAGSGKTSVLVERIVHKILNGSSLKNFLVVTFTNTSAKEMKLRIKKRLIEESQNNPKLEHEISILDNSLICTIDSFCLYIVKKKANELGISPNFRILNEYEIENIRTSAINSVLEDIYEENNPSVIKVVDTFSGENNEDRFIEYLQNWINFSSTISDIDKFIDNSLNNFCIPFESTKISEFLKKYVLKEIGFAIDFLNVAINIVQEDPELKEKYFPYINNSNWTLKKICKTKKTKNLVNNIKNFKFDSLKPAKNSENKENVKKLFDASKKIIENLKKISLNEDCKYMYKISSSFFCIAKKVNDRLLNIKKKKNIFEFHDIERFALNVLKDKKNLEDLCGDIEEIMIDECQDLNDIQDNIFRLMSKKMFLVGDYKQSIYRFRGALPEIFESKKYEPSCVTIFLNKNFRSRKEILNFINPCFRILMTKKTNSINYNFNEELKYGARYDSRKDEKYVEILKIDSENNYDGLQKECGFVAKKLKSLIDKNIQIFENGNYRKATLSDFCILIRNFSKYSEFIFDSLKNNGIRFKTNDINDFNNCYETKLIISILKIISNPMLDISLVFVLKSIIFKFTFDDLLDIRQNFPEVKLYLALKEFSKNDNILASKCRRFIEYLGELIHLYKRSSLMSLSMKIVYDLKNLEGIDNFNLEKFIYVLNQFCTSNQLVTIEQFINYISNSQTNISFEEFDKRDAVLITSVHKSKGREFPICFLVGCSSNFVNDTAEIMFDLNYGIALKSKKMGGIIEYSNIFKDSMNIIFRDQKYSEELRLLYVALTRAKDRLFIIGSSLNLSSLLQYYNLVGHHALLVKKSKSFLDWISLVEKYIK